MAKKDPTVILWHTTSPEAAQDITQEGFQGGWGDVGFGVYGGESQHSSIASWWVDLHHTARGAVVDLLRQHVATRLRQPGLGLAERSYSDALPVVSNARGASLGALLGKSNAWRVFAVNPRSCL